MCAPSIVLSERRQIKQAAKAVDSQYSFLRCDFAKNVRSVNGRAGGLYRIAVAHDIEHLILSFSSVECYNITLRSYLDANQIGLA